MLAVILIYDQVLLRPLVEQQLGGSLFEPGNFERWMRANADLLKHGLYTPPTPGTPARTAPSPEPSHAGNPRTRQGSRKCQRQT